MNARVHDINRSAISKLFTPTLEALKAAEPSLRKASPGDLEKAFVHMTERLQRASLTINLKAWSWFKQPNNYPGYSQMYERSVGADGVMRLTNADPKNPAGLRAYADDAATFPTQMVDSSFTFTGMNSVASNYQIKGTSGAAPARGLAPRTRGVGDAVQRMATGALQPSGSDFVASNPQFDPRTKQIFAALNYGRRPHGSSTQYGHSFLVLHDKFKRDALYFGGDTFGVTEGKSVKAGDQVSYDTLAALFLKANPALRTELLNSCLRDVALGDTNKNDHLVEAHLFTKLAFSDGCAELYVSGRDGKTLPDGSTTPLDGNDFQTIQTHARAFAAKHGLRLFFID